MVQQKIVWGDATKSGLVLGGVSIAYFIINILMGKLPEGRGFAVLANVSGIILWVAKLFACFALMKYFMKKFAASHEGVSNQDTFRFGNATAFLSALLFSAIYLAWVTIIDPNMFSDSIEQALAASSSMFGQAQMDAMDEMLPKLPTISFFVNLIYCWLFGVLLSAIFSRNIPSRNPFTQTFNGPDEQ